jgi:hypothetical protein
MYLQVPLDMTSNKTPVPYVASSTYGTAWYVYDNNNGTYIARTQNENNLTSQLNFGRRRTIGRYGFYKYHNPSYPRTWYVDAYINGVWTTVHTSRNNINSWQYFNIPSPTTTNNMRLRIPLTSGLYEQRLYGIIWYDYFHDTAVLPEEIVGTAEAYYVSQQHGDDANDGLTPQTAWATIEKAMAGARANINTDVHVYVGPGTYRPSSYLSVACPGIDLTHRIIYEGDPDCAHLIYDAPGEVIVTDTIENDIVPTGLAYVSAFIHFLDRQFVEIKNINIVVSEYLYAVHGTSTGNQILSDCSISSQNCGCYGITAHRCKSMCRASCFEDCMSYNCIAIGTNDLYYGGFKNGTAYNCIASLCRVGYMATTAYNSEAYLCNKVASGGTFSNCAASLVSTLPLPAGWEGSLCATSVSDIVNSIPIFSHKINMENLVKTGIYGSTYNLSDNSSASISLNGVTRRWDASVNIGPWEIPNLSFVKDKDSYNNKISIKLSGTTSVVFDYPVRKNLSSTVNIFVKWFHPEADDIDDSLKPIVIVNNCGTEIVAQCTEIKNSWQKLSIDFIPAIDGVIKIHLVAQDPTEGSYAIFSVPH